MAVLPPDPIYQSDVGLAGYGYQNNLAGINYDRTDLAQTTGFNAEGGLDPTNPFSIAANITRRYQQQQAGTTNSMAAAGQLYSGALNRARGEDYYQYQRSYDSARRSASRGFQDLKEREGSAYFNYATGLNQANSDRLGRLDPNDTVPSTPAQPAPVPRSQRLRSGYRRRSTGFGQNRPTGTWGRP